MKLISRNWWDHLAPASLHRFASEIEDQLKVFAKTDYGRVWSKAARSPHATLRLNIGQNIPVFHMISLGGAKAFLAPFRTVEPQHRTVSTLGDTDNANAGIHIVPEIRIDLATDPALIDAAKRGITNIDETRVTQPSLVFSCPAHMLLSPRGFPKKSYVLY